MTEQKEFLRIADMQKKLGGISKKQFWLLRIKGQVPEPVIKNPPTWRLKDVDAFYDKRAGL
jgi:predicted DNA-binding transcriptional regulator AlpA